MIDQSTQTQTVTVNPADTQTLTFYNSPQQTLTIQKSLIFNFFSIVDSSLWYKSTCKLNDFF